MDSIDEREILSRCDHTLLRVDATSEEIRTLCDQGMQYQTASVCIPPFYVHAAAEYIRKKTKETGGRRLLVCTVIGFPNGYATPETKAFEAADAVRSGADEIDMVVNIGMIRDGLYDQILREINLVGNAAEEHTLKVIIETCRLSREEKIRMCDVVSQSCAQFIKTSTGFSTGGATVDDVALLRKYMDPDKKVKAAGGIAGLVDAQAMLRAGADRIGTSRVVAEVIRSSQTREA